MNALDDIADVKRRFGVLEYELVQLKRKLASVEAAVTAPPIMQFPPSPRTMPAAAETKPDSVAEMEDAVIEPPVTEVPVKSPMGVEPTAPNASESEAPLAGLMPAMVAPILPPPLPPMPLPRAPFSRAAQPIEEPQTFDEPRATPRPNPLREWLEPLQLWPPEGEDNAEVRLAAWWATRVGALLAVIGIVFLGVYVSRESPPWVRLAEISAVTGAVIGLGGWLERKLPIFGAVVFGAGLALAYFCAFAAYAVAPMKVITNPLVATACELVVVGGIFGVAWRRNSPLVATMAVVLGYVTAFLALRHESLGFGPWVVLLLGTVAVGLRLARGWEGPSALAMPLTWLFLGAASFARGYGHDMPVHAVWFWCGLNLVLFMARDWIVAWRGGALGTMDRALQVTSSSLAVVVAMAAALREGGTTATQLYFGSGVVMVLSAWAWRHARVTALVPILVCKGAGLLALGVIDAFAGQMRCLVLLAQAFVMLVSARHSHQRWLRIATMITGAIALGFFLREIRGEHATFWVGDTALEIIFLAGVIGFVAALQRWVALGGKAVAVSSLIVSVVAIATASRWELHGWTPAVEMGLAAVLVLAAGSVRGWLTAGIAGGMLVATAHVELWMFNSSLHPRAILWWSELAVLGAVVAATPALARLVDEGAQKIIRGVVASVATATLVVVCFKGLAPAPALAAAASLGALLVGAAPRARGWPFAVLAAPMLVLGCLLFAAHYRNDADPWVWIATLAAWATALCFTVSPPRLDSIGAAEWRAWVPAVHTWLATAITLLALFQNLHGEQRWLATTIAAMAIAGLTWRPGLRPALEASWVLWGATIASGLLADHSGVWWFAAVASWLPAIMILKVPALAPLRTSPLPWRAHADGVQVWLATAMTLVAILINLHGPDRILGASIAALAVAMLSWRAGLRPAVEASWALWCSALLFGREGGGSGALWFAMVASWVPAIMFARVPAFAELRGGWTPWRAWSTGIQVSLATALTLLALHENLHGDIRVAVTAGAAFAALMIGWCASVRPALEASWVLWLAALAWVAMSGASGASWFAALLSWIPAILFVRGAGFQVLRVPPPQWRSRADAIQITLAAVTGTAVALDCTDSTRFVAFGALIALSVAIWRWGRVEAARPAAIALCAAGWLCGLQLATIGRAQNWSAAFAAVLAMAAVASALPFMVQRGLDREERRRLRWPAAGAGLALAFAVLMMQRGVVAPYVTVGCGIVSVLTFVGGLVARSRPHRLCGLAGLALCVPRAFIVDLDSTLHRIAAFVALGVVLLWVGFSYHRFRHLIVDEEKML